MPEDHKPVRVSPNYPGVEWTEGTGVFISVDNGKCTGCGDCLKVCLGSCYVIKDKKARIKSLDLCMECGSCWYICPQEAVIFTWPKGGTGFRTKWG